MLKKFLQEVVMLVVGKQAEGLSELLDSKKHVNEFNIAKKLGITINQTRNMLYKLANKGLVSSIRKKDKRKGWFTYFWKIEILKSLEFLKGIKNKKAEQLKNQVKSRETKEFYICERCNIEFSDENALAYNFTCPECGGVFKLKDNSKFIRDLKRHISKLEKELEEIEKEVEKERILIDKALNREIKKREKIRKLKLAAKRKARQKEREKAKKALGKKQDPNQKKQKPKKKIKRQKNKPLKKSSKKKKLKPKRKAKAKKIKKPKKKGKPRKKS